MTKYIFILLFLVGCQEDSSVVVHHPEPADVEGIWESLSIYQYFPFASIRFNRDGNGKVVLVSEEKAAFTGNITNFQSQETSFLITLTGTEEGDEPESWEGSIRRGQLCFRILEEEVSPAKMSEGELMYACFSRALEVAMYRKIAYENL